MESAGWTIDMTHIGGSPGSERFAPGCEGVPFWGYSFDRPIGKLSTVFLGHGEATIDFGSCYLQGRTKVHLNGELIGTATANQKSVVKTFSYKPGDTLRLEEVDVGIMALNSLEISCANDGK